MTPAKKFGFNREIYSFLGPGGQSPVRELKSEAYQEDFSCEQVACIFLARSRQDKNIRHELHDGKGDAND